MVSGYRRRPADVLAAVEVALREAGLARLYMRACPVRGVLSVALGVTVWTDGRLLTWRHSGHETTWPAADAEGAARRLAALYYHGSQAQDPWDKDQEGIGNDDQSR